MINIIKAPEDIYPAYNDSYLQFTSDLADNYKAEMIVYPVETFTRTFIAYADADGVYTFNLKEIIKSLFNDNDFSDQNVFSDAFYKTISGIYKELSISFEVFSTTDSETDDEVYTFYRAIKQIGESNFSNYYQLLSYSSNGVDYKLPYWVGFPFSFDLQRVQDTDIIKINNLNTSFTSDEMTPTDTDSFRIIVDKGNGENWTDSNIMPLTNTENNLEVLVNDVAKTNILIEKNDDCEGIYLKWANRNGGYNYWLFDKYYLESIKSSEYGTITNNTFENVPTASNTYKSTGKVMTKTMTIKTRYKEEYYDMLKDLFSSPCVQMYSSQVANVEGSFIDVIVEGSFTYANKKRLNSLTLSIDMPEVLTLKL